MMLMPVRCPACGGSFKDLSKHVGSEKCQLQQNRNAQVTAGRVRVYGYVARYLAANEPSFGVSYEATSKSYNQKGLRKVLWARVGPVTDFCNLVHDATHQKRLSNGKSPAARSLLPILRRYVEDPEFRPVVQSVITLGGIAQLPKLAPAASEKASP